ncbi:MAG: hypothetical protein ACE5GF_06730 [Thermodesulfobacteriota bacterium]
MRWLFILTFIIGLGLGVGGTYFAPDLLGPYLPAMFQRRGELVQGEVVAKQEKVPWLLLTINTPHGAILATFKKKVDEIALLVEVGDQIELFLRRYEPFVEDPRIKRVRKREGQVGMPPIPAEKMSPASLRPEGKAVETPAKKTSSPLPESREEKNVPEAEGGPNVASEAEGKANVEMSPSPSLPVEEKGGEEKKVGGEKSSPEPPIPSEGGTAL